jgi:Glycosyltransferase family 87
MGVAVTVVAVVVAGYWTGRAAVLDNFHQDLWIYSSGAWLGLHGQSPYDAEAMRARVTQQYPGDDGFARNNGFFLSPQAMLVFAPFAVLPWAVAKVVWSALNVLFGVVIGWGLYRLTGKGVPGWFAGAATAAVLLNPPALAVLAVGQTPLLILACVVGGQWVYSLGCNRIGCLLWALAFIKPHIALALLPLAWWLNGWKRAVEVAVWAGALNVLAGVVFYGNPLFVLEYLSFVQQGHKTVEFNRVAMNEQITAWNRLVVACGGPVIELGAMGTVMGYATFGLMVVGRVWLIRRQEKVSFAPSWPFALAGCAILACCQLLPYELPLLALVLPYLGELFASGRRRDQLLAGLMLGGIAFALIPGGEASEYYRLIRSLNLGNVVTDVLLSHRSLCVMLVSAIVLGYGPTQLLPTHLRRVRLAGAVTTASSSAVS